MAEKTIKLKIENQYCRVLNAPKTILRLLDDATSYFVDGYWFSNAYKKNHWDGKQHLMKQRATGVTFPTGLLDDVMAVLRDPDTDWPFEIEDARASATRCQYRWNGEIVMRPYQDGAVDAFCKHGFGILKMPIRSGKTKTAARVMWRLEQPSLFIVPSKLLLKQTVNSLQECFPDETIGRWGDGEKTIQRITVVIAASLVSAKRQKDALYKKLCDRVGLVVFDECFPAGTMIGDKPIESIQPGDLVPSFDPNTLEPCLGKVVRLFRKRPTSLVRIKTERGSIACTPNHPFRTQRGFVAASELDPCCDGVHHNKHGAFELLRVESVEVLELGSDGRRGGVCDNGVVYNLEVEGTHTYVADGYAVHNCHHLTANAWCEVVMGFKARYRLGLSATPQLDMAKAVKLGVIWLKAACGPMRADVDMSEMIRQGYLVRPTFHLYKSFAHERHRGRAWSTGLADDVIFLNPERNGKIASLARQWAKKGKRVLIVTRRVEQVELICAKLGRVGALTGSVKARERERLLANFVSGKTPIMIGTVFGEGVDIPEIDIVINAEGGTDEKSTTQRMRNLTPCEGKTEAIVIDFLDVTNKYFAKHSRDRLKVYRSEPEFRIVLKG